MMLRVIIFALTALAAPALCLEVDEPGAPDQAAPDFSNMLSDLEAFEPPAYIDPVGPTLGPGYEPLAEFSITPRGAKTIEPELSAEQTDLLKRRWTVNINTAPRTTLERVPFLDPIRARSIVAHREANGAFAHPQEITEVFGVTDLIYTQLASHFVCEGETTFAPELHASAPTRATTQPAQSLER